MLFYQILLTIDSQIESKYIWRLNLNHFINSLKVEVSKEFAKLPEVSGNEIEKNQKNQ